jgi:putative DNA primase/helicase
VDEAIRRRFHLVPFTVTIPPGARDPDLTAKLRTEWPGILQWAIDGCIEWQEVGLAPPPCVTDATKEYFAAQDTIVNWLNECTAEDPQAEHLASELFRSWKEWCQENNEFVGSLRAFGQRLQDTGLPHRDGKKGTLYRGRRLAA